VAAVSALVFWIFPYEVAALFLDRDDPDVAEVLGFAAVFLAVAAAFQIADNLQAVAIGILRGLKDTRTPMLMAVIAYWVIGMPTALLLGFAFGLGGWGIWLGLACGLAVACVLLLRRAHRMMPRA
jgi:MATE family multidrug resistance protein